MKRSFLVLIQDKNIFVALFVFSTDPLYIIKKKNFLKVLKIALLEDFCRQVVILHHPVNSKFTTRQ